MSTKIHTGPQAFVDQVIEAHGGAARWKCLKALEADISAWGLLFTAKRRPVLDRVRVRASTHEPRFAFLDFPHPGQVAELIGDDQVRILDERGEILAERNRPRSAFRGLRRQIYWDDLDFVYFAGYATWNYLVTPFLFLRDGFSFEVIDPRPGMPPSWTYLGVRFPADIPTHCECQIFCFDERRRLRRLDYTARVVGNWARAAHICEGYRDFDGLKAPTSRRVRPVLVGHRPLPGPTLVALEIHDICPVRAT